MGSQVHSGQGPAPDRLTRFSDRAGDYAAHRPSYPARAIDLILMEHNAASMVAADVGAGTGISARLLADRGIRVHAVEPNAAMRGAAVPHAQIEWHDGTGEATGLPARSVDLVLAAQAFHWFDPDSAIAEFRRVLRPPVARIALMWNVHDHADPAMQAYRHAIIDHATDPPQSPWFKDPGRPLARARGLSNPRVVTVPNEHAVTRDGLIGRALSASYAPKSGPAHDAMIRELHALFDRFADGPHLRMRYITEVHLAEVVT